MEHPDILNVSPNEFEELCLEILKSYAEAEKLTDFMITHNAKLPASDGTYQIDVYAEFTAMRTKIKVLCECKRYKSPVSRDKVAILQRKLESLGAQKGILISTGQFQSGAIQYAKEHGIALIRVENYKFNHLSYSSANQEINDKDPFFDAEKQMPPFVAYDDTADTETPRKVYPSAAIMQEIIRKMTQQIKDEWGVDISFPK